MSATLKAQPAAAVGSVSARLDALPLNRLQLVIVLTLGLGMFFDTVELMMTNVLATVFSTDVSVSRSEVSIMLAALFVGGAIGAPVGGRLADSFGRKPALLGVVLGYALLSMACGLSANIMQLTVARFLCGMMLAAFLPVTWTYLAEVLPPCHRGRLTMVVGAIAASAASAAPLLSRLGNEWLLFGLEGWRFTMLIGACGGLLVLMLASRLPESPRWLERTGRLAAAEAALARFGGSLPLFRPATVPRETAVEATLDSGPPSAVEAEADVAAVVGRFGGNLALLICLQFLQPLSIIGFTALSGVVMRQKGFDLSSSLLYLAVAGVGAPIGALTAVLFVDRVPRHLLYAVCCCVLGAVGVAFALSSTMAVAMLLGGVYIFMIVVFSMTLNIYGPEMFISDRRGLAAGLGYSAHRVGAAMVPLALLPLLHAQGAVVVYGVIAAAMAVSAMLVMAFGPRGATGRALR